jgi:rubrerythrin
MESVMTIADNTFAAACFDQNSIADLEAALINGPDSTDMLTWKLTKEEWIEQINLALQEKRAEVRIDRPWFLNHYHCAECNESWSDEWSCTSDDECPVCGKDYEPESSEAIEFPDDKMHPDED